MPITRTPMVDDDGSGTTGTIINNAWKSELYDQIDALAAPSTGAGAWQAMAGTFHIQNDLGTALTATILVNRYRRLGGNTVLWQFGANPITLPAVSQNLYLVQMPFALLGPTGASYPVALAPSLGYLTFIHAGALSAKRADAANWAAGSVVLHFSITLEASGG